MLEMFKEALGDVPMKNNYIILLIVFISVGCAASSGIVPMGKDTYISTKQGWISTQSVGALKAEIYKEANAYCLQRNKKLMPVSSNVTPGVLGYSYPEAELQFMCLNDSDYELQRPKLKPLPNVRIEDAR